MMYNIKAHKYISAIINVWINTLIKVEKIEIKKVVLKAIVLNHNHNNKYYQADY